MKGRFRLDGLVQNHRFHRASSAGSLIASARSSRTLAVDRRVAVVDFQRHGGHGGAIQAARFVMIAVTLNIQLPSSEPCWLWD